MLKGITGWCKQDNKISRLKWFCAVYFFWFCDVESDVTNRNLTLRCSLAGASSMASLCYACSSESAENKGWTKWVLLTHPPPCPLLLRHPPAQTHLAQFSRCTTFTRAFTVPAGGGKPEPRSSHQVHALSTRISTPHCILLGFNVRPLHNNLLCSCTSWHLNGYIAPKLMESRFYLDTVQSKLI